MTAAVTPVQEPDMGDAEPAAAPPSEEVAAQAEDAPDQTADTVGDSEAVAEPTDESENTPEDAPNDE